MPTVWKLYAEVMKKAGVSETPASSPAFLCISTSFAFPPESRHWSNLPPSRPRLRRFRPAAGDRRSSNGDDDAATEDDYVLTAAGGLPGELNINWIGGKFDDEELAELGADYES